MKKGFKIKKFFSNRRNLWIFVSVVSALVVALIGLFFWLIYTKDQPKLLPVEVRGKVRKGIEQGVGENVKKVAPDLGQAIIDASYDNQNGKIEESPNPNTHLDTSNWQTYADDTMGISMKAPKDWTVWDKGDDHLYFSNQSDAAQLISDEKINENTDSVFWGGRAIMLKRVDQNEKVKTAEEYVGKFFSGDGISVSPTKLNGLAAYYIIDHGADRFGGGTGYYYVLEKDGKVFELSLDYFLDQPVSTEMQQIFQTMAATVG